MILHPCIYTSNLGTGLHAIENPSSDVHAVSLHCYIPPITECNKFNQKTGEKQKATMKYDTRP